MKKGLNKKILCFVDEFGTAGDQGFGLGAVVLWSRDCALADRVFTNLLPANANEVHARDWSMETLQTLMGQYGRDPVHQRLLMVNKVGEATSGSRAEIYGKVLVETVKVALKNFGSVHRLTKLGNVDVILDATGLNEHADFLRIVKQAQAHDGRFRSVRSVSRIDSSAARMLQVADVVAYSRNWIGRAGESADSLRQKYGIAYL